MRGSRQMAETVGSRSREGIARRGATFRLATLACFLVCATSVDPAAAATFRTGVPSATMQTDLLKRERAINWPPGFEPDKADLFAHNELLIEADCRTIWGHIVDAAEWPRWYPNASDVKLLDGARRLGAGTRWRWTTFGIDIESRVHEFVPDSRLGWYGYAPDQPPTFYHSWYLAPQSSRCLVSMDEVGVGADAAKLRGKDEGLMHRGHDLWLAGLKWVSETKR